MVIAAHRQIHEKVTSTITLTPEEVKKILIEHITNKGHEIKELNFLVSSHIEGFGTAEYEVKTFDGISFTKEEEL